MSMSKSARRRKRQERERRRQQWSSGVLIQNSWRNWGDATIDMDRLRPTFDPQLLSFPIIHSDFAFTARLVRERINLDTELAREAGRRIARQLEDLILGNIMTFQEYVVRTLREFNRTIRKAAIGFAKELGHKDGRSIVGTRIGDLAAVPALEWPDWSETCPVCDEKLPDPVLTYHPEERQSRVVVTCPNCNLYTVESVTHENQNNYYGTSYWTVTIGFSRGYCDKDVTQETVRLYKVASSTYPGDNTEELKAFIRKVAVEKTTDHSTILMFADWLADHGYPVNEACLRKRVEDERTKAEAVKEEEDHDPNLDEYGDEPEDDE